jgi:hypothetical protein
MQDTSTIKSNSITTGPCYKELINAITSQKLLLQYGAPLRILHFVLTKLLFENMNIFSTFVTMNSSTTVI